MTPRQQDLIRASWAMVEPIADPWREADELHPGVIPAAAASEDAQAA